MHSGAPPTSHDNHLQIDWHAVRSEPTQAVEVLESVCSSLESDRLDEAQTLLQDHLPFAPLRSSKRQYTDRQKMSVFARDGFIDRYSGERLVSPGVLRALSVVFPNEFPYQRNWKLDSCHIAYWQLHPTIDHVVPVSRSGRDERDNWVTTSQMRNSMKSGWTLEELGWELKPKGDLLEWDGLSSWLVEYVDSGNELQDNAYVMSWVRLWMNASNRDSPTQQS